MRGAEVRRMAWEKLPVGLLELVRKRVGDDPLVAAHALASDVVHAVRVDGSTDIPLEPVPFTTLLVEAAPGSTLRLRETAARASLSAERPWSSTLLMLHAGAGSRVSWFGSSVGAPGCSVVERLVLLEQDASVELHSALVAANALRDNTHVILAQPGAFVRVNTLFVGASDPTSPEGLRGADHQFDLGVTAEHRAPHTVSDLRARGVLGGKAQGIYRGLVRVEKNATGSDGYQRCDALLLSPTAEVDPIPSLEINTNDVRCTHGVTISHVNPEHLFYLQSRGCTEDAARTLLVDGFIDGLLGRYPQSDQEILRAAIRRTYEL